MFLAFAFQRTVKRLVLHSLAKFFSIRLPKLQHFNYCNVISCCHSHSFKGLDHYIKFCIKKFWWWIIDQLVIVFVAIWFHLHKSKLLLNRSISFVTIFFSIQVINIFNKNDTNGLSDTVCYKINKFCNDLPVSTVKQ